MTFDLPVQPLVSALETYGAVSGWQVVYDGALAKGRQSAAVKGRFAPDVALRARVNALIGNEAFAMLEAGVASPEDIDKAVKLGLNHPMGPFEMVDLVGLDVRLRILEYLHSTLGEKYRPNELLQKLVADGRLGRKSGRGVYDYTQQKPTKLAP